jgi:glycosyltransferase involved in cell wall biosynthesis
MSRVLHLIDHNGLGGAQRLLAGLLARRPQDLALPLRGKLEYLLPWPDDHPLPASITLRESYLAQLGSLLALPRWWREHEFDLLHCHLQVGWLAGLWLKLLNPKLPVIFHEHNPYLKTSPLYRLLAKQAARAGKIIAVSNFVAGLLKKHGIPAEQTLVLPNYVDIHKFTPSTQPRPANSWSNDMTVVGFAGRLVEQKGWRSLLNVADLLRNEPARFLVAGSGPGEFEMRQLIRKMKLEENIQMLGFVDDMRPFYRAIDIFLFPSRLEPFGLVALEAQACGVPVVAFDIPGVNEAISPSNAQLVPVGADEQLAFAIQHLIGEMDLRASVIRAGLENAKQHNLDQYLAHLEEIYQSLSGTNDSGAC